MNEAPSPPFDHVTTDAPNGRAGAPIPVPDIDTFALKDGRTFRLDVSEAKIAFLELYQQATAADPPATQREYLEACRAYVAQYDAGVAAGLSLGQLEWLIDQCAILADEKKSERADVYARLVGSQSSTGSGRGR